jgi:hypothetical protein
MQVQKHVSQYRWDYLSATIGIIFILFLIRKWRSN